MTTNRKFRWEDKRTWYKSFDKKNIEKIAANVPEKDMNAVIKYFSSWVNLDGRKKNKNNDNNNQCRFASTCPLYYDCRTCNDEDEASFYCGKYRELARKR